jgi:hypothetical protein
MFGPSVVLVVHVFAQQDWLAAPPFNAFLQASSREYGGVYRGNVHHNLK